MPNLFGRQYQFTVAPLKSDPKQGIDADQALVISDLRIQFHIKMTSGHQSNVAKITVTNLSEESRAKLQKSGTLRVELLAGYEGAVAQIYSGNILRCYSRREKHEWETHFETEDGAEARATRLQFAFGKTTKGAVANKIVDQTPAGVSVGNAKVAIAGTKRAFDQCKAAHAGTWTECMAKALAPLGLEHTINNGELLVAKKGQPLAKEAVLISPQTGLIGSPEVAKKGVIKLRTLINVALAPFRAVTVKSLYVNGTFRIEKTTYKGDSRGHEWHAELEVADPKIPHGADD